MKRTLILLIAATLSFSTASAQMDSTHGHFMAGLNVVSISFLTPPTSPIVNNLNPWQIINYEQDFTRNALVGVNFKWNLDDNVWLNLGVNWIYSPAYNYSAVIQEGAGGADSTSVKGSSSAVLIYAGVGRRYGNGKIKLVPGINWEIFDATENTTLATTYYGQSNYNYHYTAPFSYNTLGLGLNPVLGVEFDLGRFSIVPQTGVNLLFIQSTFSYPYTPGYSPSFGKDFNAGLRLTWDVISQIAVDYRF
jgi:hypothetical protein